MDKFFGKIEEPREKIIPHEDMSAFVEDISPRLLDASQSINDIKKLEDVSFEGKSTEYIKKVKSAIVSSKKATGKLMKLTLTRLLPLYIAYIGAGHVMQKEDGKFSEKDRARKELEEKGITSEQASTYKLGINDLIYRGITPIGYPQKQDNVFYTENTYWRSLIPNLVMGRENYGVIGKDKNNVQKIINPDIIPNSEDAWLMYLGLPQKNHTFGISSYQPKDSKQDMYYYKINMWTDLLERFISYEMENIEVYIKRLNNLYQGDNNKMLEHAEIKMPHHQFEQFKIILEKGKEGFKNDKFLDLIKKIDQSGCTINAMGMFNNMEYDTDIETLLNNYTISLGEDEKGSYLSYYDKWDLDVSTEESGKGFGRAFEIYDRVYYNPKTGEIINDLLSK